MNSKISLIITVAAGVILIAAGSVAGYQFGFNSGQDNGKLETALGVKCPACSPSAPIANIDAIVGNPLKDMPSVNPMEGVVNPFTDSYKNPFE